MKLGFITAVVLTASFACFTTEASAQLFGRHRVQHTTTKQPTKQHVHTHAQPQVINSTPATVVPNATPTTTSPSSAVPSSASPTVTQTTYYPSTAVAAQPATSKAYNSTIFMMLDRNNQIRGSRGMSAMRLSDRLTNAAQHHASYMARTGQFSHYANGSPQSRANMFGFGGGVRENIAMGQGSVSSAFQDWTNSSGHYTNMMSHSNAAGFGYAVNSSGQGYWVAMYGNE